MNILIIGAGRSSGAAITYCLEHAEELNLNITVADFNLALAESKVANFKRGTAVRLDASNKNERRSLIQNCDLVVSLLPAHLHLEVAHDCIDLRKHLITASYVSKELYLLGEKAQALELIFMGEMGLDPGVDHMSAMKTINELREKGAKLLAFKSYCGGLISPENDTNPWHYKITWNPRNVVLAGQGTAHYLEEDKLKCIPYHRLFDSITPVEVPGLGTLEMYPNRDSLLYRTTYGLDDIPTLVRGTFRYPGYCKAWSALVRIGMTDSHFPILTSGQMTYAQLLESYIPSGIGGDSIRARIANFLELDEQDEVLNQLEWLGLFTDEKIGMDNAAPADILQKIIEDKWKLEPGDKDLVAMQHEFDYVLNGEKRRRYSTMILPGDEKATAMARLVGLPLGIFVRLMAQDKIASRGVKIPIMNEVYEPVLRELEKYNVTFTERDILLED